MKFNVVHNPPTQPNYSVVLDTLRDLVEFKREHGDVKIINNQGM